MRINEATGKTTAYNSTYPKGGFSCSKDSFVGNQTLVFQIMFCGKSLALRVAAKRCVLYCLTERSKKNIIKNIMIDINNREKVSEKLNLLQTDSLPFFGKMTAQHMVEHLTFAIMFSNGKLPQKLYFPIDKAEIIKKTIIYSDKEMPIGFKAPMLNDDLLELKFPDLKFAISILLSELNRFDKYFKENKDATPINPTMGELNKQEWTIFHNKHFEHHFKQFNLT
jgi:oxepin-CoA hydrolase/3-oxo-5,6-dehydrosuberyl-CoA semialdehyde dehydrogenase